MSETFETMNGVAASWSDILLTVAVAGGPSIKGGREGGFGLKAVKFGAERKVGLQKRGGLPYKRTSGDVDFTNSMTLYKDGWVVLRDALAKVAPVVQGVARIGLVPFDILVDWTPAEQPNSIDTVRLISLRITKSDQSPSEGSDPGEVEVELSIMSVQEKTSDGKWVTL